MGTYTRSELEFILNQLKLAGAYDDAPAPAHSDPAAGTPPNDVLLGTSAGDLVFGFAGTDYIVTGPGQMSSGPGPTTALPSTKPIGTCCSAMTTMTTYSMIATAMT